MNKQHFQIRFKLFSLIALLVGSFHPHASAENPSALIERATLVFSDDFNHTEDDDAIEQVGNGWVTIRSLGRPKA